MRSIRRPGRVDHAKFEPAPFDRRAGTKSVHVAHASKPRVQKCLWRHDRHVCREFTAERSSQTFAVAKGHTLHGRCFGRFFESERVSPCVRTTLWDKTQPTCCRGSRAKTNTGKRWNSTSRRKVIAIMPPAQRQVASIIRPRAIES